MAKRITANDLSNVTASPNMLYIELSDGEETDESLVSRGLPPSPSPDPRIGRRITAYIKRQNKAAKRPKRPAKMKSKRRK